MTRKPVIIDADRLDAAAATPADAPPVPEPDLPGPPPAMARGLRVAAQRTGWFGRLVWAALGALLALTLGVWAWDFALSLLSRNVWLGRVAMTLGAIVLVALVLFVLREIAALARLARVDRLQGVARDALATQDRGLALGLATDIARLYRARPELRLPTERLRARRDEMLDADALLHLVERELLTPLDAEARREVEAAARTVAAATALVPLALADVAVALASNVRMVRRIAVIYGGRAGTFGSLRLLRAVAAHLLATGAVAVGDDMISSVAGGGALSRISRRFGEGVVNGALTARVGIATMEVCRPMPFAALPRPRVTALLQRALSGLFARA